MVEYTLLNSMMPNFVNLDTNLALKMIYAHAHSAQIFSKVGRIPNFIKLKKFFKIRTSPEFREKTIQKM